MKNVDWCWLRENRQKNEWLYLSLHYLMRMWIYSSHHSNCKTVSHTKNRPTITFVTEKYSHSKYVPYLCWCAWTTSVWNVSYFCFIVWYWNNMQICAAVLFASRARFNSYVRKIKSNFFSTPGHWSACSKPIRPSK